MSQRLGAENEKAVIAEYEKMGGICLNMHDLGMPDLLYMADQDLIKQMLFIEVKTPRHRVHAHQMEFMEKLRGLGAKVEVVLVQDGKIVDTSIP